MELIKSIDIWLYYFINVKLSNPVFDAIMPIITELNYWLPVYIIFFVLLLWKGGKKGRIAVLLVLITVLISDQLSSIVLKELIGRLRPCHELSGIHLLVNCGGGKSFPSSHAVNNFAAATVLTYYFSNYKWTFISIASLVSLSRICVGVHYPLDVIGGAFIGFITGFALVWFTKLVYKSD